MANSEPTGEAFKYKLLVSSFIGALVCIACLYFNQLYYHDTAHGEIIKSFIEALMSTFIVAAIFDVTTKASFIKTVRGEIFAVISDSMDRISNIKKNGLRNVFRGLPYDRFLVDVKQSSKILILQTYIPDFTSISDEVLELLVRGGTVRILILDEVSEVVKIRAESLERSQRYFESGIKNNIEDFQRLNETRKGHGILEVRQFSELPSVSIYSTDSSTYVGHFLKGTHAVEGPQLELEYNNYYSKQILDYFEEIWKNARQLQL